MNIDTNINGTTQPHGLIYHSITKVVHIGKTGHRTYCAIHVDYIAT